MMPTVPDPAINDGSPIHITRPVFNKSHRNTDVLVNPGFHILSSVGNSNEFSSKTIFITANGIAYINPDWCFKITVCNRLSALVYFQKIIKLALTKTPRSKVFSTYKYQCSATENILSYNATLITTDISSVISIY